MVSVLPPIYSLSEECPVRWTIAQERALNDKEFQCCDDSHVVTAPAYARQTYLRFLWLPESIMPLRALFPALLRIQSTPSSTSGSSTAMTSHPLHDILRPLLLTPRYASQKYHTRINQMIEDDSATDDNESHMMWLAYRNAKGDEELEQQTQDPGGAVNMFDAEEAWKDRWLARMEQREVQIQIILHFLLLSLPGAPSPPTEEPKPELPAHLSPPKKRRQKRKEVTPPPQPSLDECLELFMDKLSMWQLMSTLDAQDAERERGGTAQTKGKRKAEDERDWMQVFCEDVVEPHFITQLPDLCKLLRSKVFQDSAFADDPASPMSTPPPSPRPTAKRLKSSAPSCRQTTAPSRVQRHAKDTAPDPRELQRSRSRSLSHSLEQERARSQSISTAPRKRTLVREVSMTTAFKGKAQARARERERATARARERERATARAAAQKTNALPVAAGAAKAQRGTKVVTLVAATPVKLKERGRPMGTSQAADGGINVLPLPKCELGNIVEGGEDDDEWTLPSSPDVLLLGSRNDSQPKGPNMVEGDEEDVLGWMERNVHLAVTDSPTKHRQARRRM